MSDRLSEGIPIAQCFTKDSKVHWALANYQKGMTMQNIGKVLGVHRTTVSEWIKRNDKSINNRPAEL